MSGFFVIILARFQEFGYICDMKMVTILGPTASGKTAIAARLAYEIGGEVISADSRQVYRGMDIGTGKDLADYSVNGLPIPYHLIDIADAGTKYNLFQYQQDFHIVYNDIRERGVVPILCGGSGLYIEAVIKGYALSPVPQNHALRSMLKSKSLPELTDILVKLKIKAGVTMHNTTDVDSCQRAIRAIEIETYNLEHATELRKMPPVDSVIVGVGVNRDVRRKKISDRLSQRLQDGMVDEVRGLLEKGISPSDLIYYGLEYKYVTEYVIGNISYEEMYRQLEIAIHQFAKRQMTWYRGMERRGLTIHWIDGQQPLNEIMKDIKCLMD